MGICSSTKVTSKVILPAGLETGDLVLFRTKSMAANCTRFCTDGEKQIKYQNIKISKYQNKIDENIPI
jgi:hypothetical protein